MTQILDFGNVPLDTATGALGGYIGSRTVKFIVGGEVYTWFGIGKKAIPTSTVINNIPNILADGSNLTQQANRYLGKTISVVDNMGNVGSVSVPSGWKFDISFNNKGIVFYDPVMYPNGWDKSTSKSIIRVTNPDTQYTSGYIRKYNASQQPLNLQDSVGSRETSHFNITQ